MSELTIEPYRPGDEADMLALFARVFGASRSPEHWRWQFGDNPYGGPFVTLARRVSDRELVGQHVIMPFPLNVKGSEVLAGQSLDLAVHPEHRRQGIFEATARDCYARCQAAGMQALVAFPNESSYPGFVRTLGWERLVVPTRHALRLGWAGGLGRIGVPGFATVALDWPLRALRTVQTRRWRHGTARDLAVRWSTTAPAEAERLWDAVRSTEVLSLWKDRRYLEWRYDANPSHAFRYLSLERGNDPVALAVVTLAGRRALIGDLIVRGREVAVGRRLVGEICAALAREPVDQVEFLGHDQGFFKEILTGFNVRRAMQNVYVGRSLGNDALGQVMCRADNWTLSYGDGDFF